MSVKYSVVPNPLQPGQFYPRPVAANTRDLKIIIDQVAQKTTIAPPDIAAVVQAFIQEIIDGLAFGDRVAIDDLADFSVRLSQVLTSGSDEFDFDQGGELLIAATIKPQVTDAVRHKAQVEKVVSGTKVPKLTSFRDVATNLKGQYTPGGIAEIDGDNLKIFDDSAPEQGIFFLAASDGSEVRADQIQNNGDRQLVFLVPPSLTGQQQVQVRTRYTQGGILRVGTLEGFLNPA